MGQAVIEVVKPKKSNRYSRELILLLSDESKKIERDKLRLTQKEVAGRMGYSAAHFSRVINGKASCTRKFEKKAARLLQEIQIELSNKPTEVFSREQITNFFVELKQREISRCPSCGQKLNQSQQQVIEAVRHGYRTTRLVAELLQISSESAANRLRSLVDMGLLVREKKSTRRGGTFWIYRVEGKTV